MGPSHSRCTENQLKKLLGVVIPSHCASFNDPIFYRPVTAPVTSLQSGGDIVGFVQHRHNSINFHFEVEECHIWLSFISQRLVSKFTKNQTNSKLMILWNFNQKHAPKMVKKITVILNAKLLHFNFSWNYEFRVVPVPHKT